MALKPREKHLLFVSVSQKATVGTLRYGAHIERQLGATIDDLILGVCADRFSLARQFFRSAGKVQRCNPPQYRSAILRAYYATYHSARAVVYIAHGGDDFEAHSTLSQKLPDDFPAVATWRNTLREARLLRNRADYDPYPRLQNSFAVECSSLMNDAKQFMLLAEQYLRGRGCAV